MAKANRSTKWREAPPSKIRPQAEFLLAANFCFDRFPQYPLSNFRGYWGKRSISLYLFLVFALNLLKSQELLTNSSHLRGKWKFCSGLCPQNKNSDYFEKNNFECSLAEHSKVYYKPQGAAGGGVNV